MQTHTLTAIASRRVLTPEGMIDGHVLFNGSGQIEAVSAGAPPAGAQVHDVGNKVVMPGLVDTHVHINDPGRAHWEGFETATGAAAAGGVTTLIEMPLNSIPSTTSVDAFETKVSAAKGRLAVDVGFWGGVVPGNTDELKALFEAGAWGFKCFLSPSGVDEFENAGLEDLEKALPILSRLGAVLQVHAEWPPALNPAAWDGADVRDHGAWLATRPPRAEREAVEHLLALSRRFDAHIHIVHVADVDTARLIGEARSAGARVTAETCPHYLTFCAEEIPLGATAFKCAPPLRQSKHREGLWEALGNGWLDFVVTDHSPSPPELKCLDTGDFAAAWGGIASLQLLLPAVWTGARRRGHSLEVLGQWLCQGPAAMASLQDRKGALAAGLDADVVVWDPDAEFEVQAEALLHRHKVTPYAGMRLAGVVEQTWVRGRRVYDRTSTTRPDQGPFVGSVLQRGGTWAKRDEKKPQQG